MFGFIAEAFEKGGANMFVILGIAVFMFAIIIERLVVLYFQANVDKDDFMRKLTKYILVGDLRNAIKLCSMSKFPMAKILHAGLTKAKESDGAVQAAMDEAALREIPKIEKRIGFLAVIGNVGVLAGLLGTIFGLIASFAAAANAEAASKATQLADGISEAMFNTAFGLAVAITASIFYAFYQAKSQSLVDTINEGTVTTLNLITANRDKFDDKVSE